MKFKPRKENPMADKTDTPDVADVDARKDEGADRVADANKQDAKIAKALKSDDGGTRRITDPDASNLDPDANLPPVAPDSYVPSGVGGVSTGNLIGAESPQGSVPESEDPAAFQKTEAENIERARKEAGITDAGAPSEPSE